MLREPFSKLSRSRGRRLLLCSRHWQLDSGPSFPPPAHSSVYKLRDLRPPIAVLLPARSLPWPLDHGPSFSPLTHSSVCQGSNRQPPITALHPPRSPPLPPATGLWAEPLTAQPLQCVLGFKLAPFGHTSAALPLYSCTYLPTTSYCWVYCMCIPLCATPSDLAPSQSGPSYPHGRLCLPAAPLPLHSLDHSTLPLTQGHSGPSHPYGWVARWATRGPHCPFGHRAASLLLGSLPRFARQSSGQGLPPPPEASAVGPPPLCYRAGLALRAARRHMRFIWTVCGPRGRPSRLGGQRHFGAGGVHSAWGGGFTWGGGGSRVECSGHHSTFKQHIWTATTILIILSVNMWEERENNHLGPHTANKRQTKGALGFA